MEISNLSDSIKNKRGHDVKNTILKQTLGSSSSPHKASHMNGVDNRANNETMPPNPKTITAAVKQAKELRAYKSYNTPENL